MVLIPRLLEARLRALARTFPAVTVTGPRQSGKTTLCRHTFPEHRYVSLERPDVRARALDDPEGFLDELDAGAVLDEIQRVPELASYLQPRLDASREMGRFILTGSQNLALAQTTTQSLAGRTAMVELLPFDFEELDQAGHGQASLLEMVWRGAWPAVFDRGAAPRDWLAAYVATYLERDVRQLLGVGDLTTFETFLRLCAGRTATLLNLTDLGSVSGVSQATARRWLSVLRASYVVFDLPPWSRNLGKRLVRRRKVYFWDTGLACYLLDIRTPDELAHHPLRGPLVESWVVAEAMKHALHRAERPHGMFYRDRRGVEVDLVTERADRVRGIEVKAGRTLGSDAFRNLVALRTLVERDAPPRTLDAFVVYGGEEAQSRSAGRAVPWRELHSILD